MRGNTGHILSPYTKVAKDAEYRYPQYALASAHAATMVYFRADRDQQAHELKLCALHGP